MSKRMQLAGVLIPLLVAEIASYFHLATALSWAYPLVLAHTTALALVSLLLGGIVAVGQDLSDALRKRIISAGTVLLLLRKSRALVCSAACSAPG